VIKVREEAQFEVQAVDTDGMLVGFLSQLIVLHETEDWVFGDFDVQFTKENCLAATARGEKFDFNRHGGGIQVKGVSYHMMKISDATSDQPACAQVLFDI